MYSIVQADVQPVKNAVTDPNQAVTRNVADIGISKMFDLKPT
jgi:vesicle coat complex subunit